MTFKTLSGRKVAIILAAVALPVAGTLPAIAADKYVPPSEPLLEDTQHYSGAPFWQGLYLGASVGYGWGESNHVYNRNDNHGLATRDLDGVAASLTMGYNHMLAPNFLVGIEGDLGIMNLDDSDRVIFDGHVWKTQYGGFWGTLRGRAGFVWDRALIYGTAGLAFMDIDEVGIGDADGQTATNQSFKTGWVVGGGVEYALTNNISAKIEYLHMDFGRHDGLSENQETYYFENKVDIIRTGLNFNF
jgi:outer membrane immunogenic protein